MLWPGCDCDEDTASNAANQDELDSGIPDDVDDGNDDTAPDPNGDDEDTGPPEPVDPCEDVSCGDEETCYEGLCFDNCNNDLECADGEHCFQGRCAPTDCDGVDCPEDQNCYRGHCYDACSDDDDCPPGGGITCVDGACVSLDDQCDNLECDQISCPADGDRTTLTGTVHIPSGDFPLPNASVYVPNDELEEITEGASCERCEDMLTGDPLVQAVTDVHGNFELINVPVTDDLPVVIQSGKWRRKIHISDIDPCAENHVTDEDLTRLPRNQSEGNIPDIAVTTGGWDSLECLTHLIGLDDEEFSTPDGDGKVNLFTAVGGSSNFAPDVDGGNSFPQANQWWHDLDNLMDYDIIMHSCEGSQNTHNKSPEAYQAFRDFTHAGGRAFASHWENEWLQHAPELDQVTDWAGGGSGNTAEINTSFSDGQDMYDWMEAEGALDANGHFDVNDARFTIGNLDESVAELWLTYTTGTPLYFAFNTPLNVPEEEQCGRVVFSDLHVGNPQDSGDSFPSQCATAATPQEIALIYMFFDLTACIAPECDPITCDDVDNNCGIHPDECGGTIDCGHCCFEIDEPCDDDEDCCDSLWCDGDTGLCTDRCRELGEACTTNSECCSDMCAISGGDDEGQCILG